MDEKERMVISQAQAAMAAFRAAFQVFFQRQAHLSGPGDPQPIGASAEIDFRPGQAHSPPFETRRSSRGGHRRMWSFRVLRLQPIPATIMSFSKPIV